MKYKHLLLILALMSAGLMVTAQDSGLLDYSKKLDDKYRSELAKTNKLADSLGIVKRVERNGAVIQLSHFVKGFPRFLTTSNLNAAGTTSTSAVWPGGSAGLNLSGSGITLGLWDESKARITHQEFGGRVTVADGATYYAGHSTHVAGTMVGSGSINLAAKGMSFMASLRSSDWNDDISEMAAAAATGLQVSNHSYTYLTGWYNNYRGDGKWVWFGDTTFSRTTDYGFGAYESTSHDWDTVAWMAPGYLIVKSSDNNRFEGPTSQPVQHWLWNGGSWVLSSSIRDKDGANGFDCIPWQGGAKNILTVGAVNDIPGGYLNPGQVVLASFSGTGPADDGRIKPDLVANGVSLYSTYSDSDTAHAYMSGTSMATPNTSGSIGLLLQHQKNLTGSSNIRSATVKGLLIHTADEAGTTAGPDYTYGWGLLNTKKAALLMSENAANGFSFNIRELTLNQGDTIRIPLYTSGTQPLAATIVWTDRPSHIYTAFVNDTTHMLVNNLDLRLISNAPLTYYPWKLKGTTPAAAATKGDNNVDNVEKVEAGSPAAQQTWYIQITHKGTLVGGHQDFSLIVSGIKLPPAASDWNGAAGTDWYSPSNWSNGVPGSTTNITIPAGKPHYPTLNSLASCKNIIIESGATLLDNGLLSITGTASVNCNITGSAWHLVSAPVSNAKASVFLNKYLQKHTEVNNQYNDITSVNELLSPMKGYALWGDLSGFTATYSGILNTGVKSLTLTRTTTDLINSGWNLAGNPYPSSIDWDATLGWTKTNVNNAVYIEKNGNWATYVGGTGTNGGSRYIAAGQGFFVSVAGVGAGTLAMNNNVRVHNTATFFKDTFAGSLVRLNVSGNGYADETVVRLMPEATDEFDGSMDAIKLFGSEDASAQIYTLGSIPLTINSLRPETVKVPLGIHSVAGGKYTITATEITGLPYVTLHDTKTGKYTDLALKSYDFSVVPGEEEQRFSLLFQSLAEIHTENTNAYIYGYQHTIYVNLKNKVSGDIYIYTITGKLIASNKAASGTTETTVEGSGIFVVKVFTADEIVVKKVFLW